MHCKTKFVTNKKILVALSKSKDGTKIVQNSYNKRFEVPSKRLLMFEKRDPNISHATSCNIN